MYHFNRIKNKNPMIISIDIEKKIDKIKHSFLTKILSDHGTEENF